jgi:SAM-dependent methyltransferase
MRTGRISSERPLSSEYGFDRGIPIDRSYIERFLADHSSDIRGRVLEVGDDSYSRRFGGEAIERQDVLHIRSGNPAATIVGDLADPKTLPPGTFDCIILTQTLQYVFELEVAVANLRRALKPGGVLLLTVPASAPICADEWKSAHLWLFTARSVQRLLSASFDSAKVDVRPCGNLFAASAFLQGACVEEVPKRKLLKTNDDYAITIVTRAEAS